MTHFDKSCCLILNNTEKNYCDFRSQAHWDNPRSQHQRSHVACPSYLTVSLNVSKIPSLKMEQAPYQFRFGTDNRYNSLNYQKKFPRLSVAA